MHETLKALLAEKVVLTDGAWGTQFQQKGLPLGMNPDIWNLDEPQKVYEVAKSYVDAGSQIILSNTFGANVFILRNSGNEDKVYAINRAGVEISKKAAGTQAKVFASMGPSGIMLLMGEVTPDEMLAAFTEQARAMADGGADGIVVETMCDLEEAKLAIQAAKTTGLPVVGSMVFDSGAMLDHTMMGNSVEDAAAGMLEAGADIVGSNCGKGIEGFLNVCRRLNAVSGEKVWIKANRGLPEVVHGETRYSQTPEQFAAYLPQLLEFGAGFVGGCCGTSPEFIRAVKNAI
ncbi:MAG: homocysteine S-methyltransferase family protein [Planctomycetia bacterium]|nr:homocysteine S-methyltransferase family protein [Planctomycetia bacterium]